MNNEKEKSKHDKSWIEREEEEIKEEVQHMDTDFPLSGGDESEPAVIHQEKKETDKEKGS